MKNIDSIFTTRTYGGCLEGVPSPEAVIRSAKQEAVKLFGERATLVVEPPIRDGMFPQWRHIVYVTGSEPVDPSERYLGVEADGSLLVIIWFTDHYTDGSGQNFKELLESIEWNNHAKNFWY